MNKKFIIPGLVAVALCVGTCSQVASGAEKAREKPGIEKRVDNVQAKPQEKREYRISQKGLDLIKECEGFRSEVYLCPAGKQTIGYGHLIGKGENYGKITEQEAEKLLRQDVQKAEEAVNRYVQVPITPGQYDALVDFTYNLGEGNLKNSTLLRKLNSGDNDGASNEFGRWTKANGKTLKGLEIRREKEKEMFTRK
jgi:lysozyme